MLTGQPKETFEAFYDAVRHNEALPAKTTYLLHLATAMAVGCVPCMEYYLKQKEQEGVSETEISTVQAIVMAVSSGRVNAQLREAELKVKKG
jgi:alkylhydroperoxidase/carboxymuconolactone decarboxylase family protein YurZ